MLTSSAKGKLLIVDDEPLVLEILKTSLKKCGYEIIASSSALEALSYIKKNSFDVIICDVRLEELNGYELLSFAKNKNPLTNGILITGAPSDEDRIRAEELNAQYFLKPLSLEKITKAVEVYFQDDPVMDLNISYSTVNLI